MLELTSFDTSQLYSQFETLKEARAGEQFTRDNGVVLHSNTNVAEGILQEWRILNSPPPCFLKNKGNIARTDSEVSSN